MKKKPKAEEIAARLAEIQAIPVCDDCDVLRGANLFAIKHYGQNKGGLFEKNLSNIVTTHVDLGCRECPVDDVMKLFSKDRFTAIAAMF